MPLQKRLNTTIIISCGLIANLNLLQIEQHDHTKIWKGIFPTGFKM
jgi:hypothetical protein